MHYSPKLSYCEKWDITLSLTTRKHELEKLRELTENEELIAMYNAEISRLSDLHAKLTNQKPKGRK